MLFMLEICHQNLSGPFSVQPILRISTSWTPVAIARLHSVTARSAQWNEPYCSQDFKSPKTWWFLYKLISSGLSSPYDPMTINGYKWYLIT